MPQEHTGFTVIGPKDKVVLYSAVCSGGSENCVYVQWAVDSRSTTAYSGFTCQWAWTKDTYTYTADSGSFSNQGYFPTLDDKYIMFPESPEIWDAVQVRCTGTTGRKDTVSLYSAVCSEDASGTTVGQPVLIGSEAGSIDLAHEIYPDAAENCIYIEWTVDSGSSTNYSGFTCEYTWTLDTYIYTDDAGTISNQGYFSSQDDVYVMYPETPDSWDGVQLSCSGTVGPNDTVTLYAAICSEDDSGITVSQPAFMATGSGTIHISDEIYTNDPQNCAFVEWTVDAESSTDYTGFTCDYIWTAAIFTIREDMGTFTNHGYFPTQDDKYIMYPESDEDWDAVQVTCTGSYGTTVFKPTIVASDSGSVSIAEEIYPNGEYLWTDSTVVYVEESGSVVNPGYFTNQHDMIVLYPETRHTMLSVACTGITGPADTASLYQAACEEDGSTSREVLVVTRSGEVDISYDHLLDHYENCALLKWDTDSASATEGGFSCHYEWADGTGPHTYTYTDASGEFSNQGYYNDQVDSYVMIPEVQAKAEQTLNTVQITCSGTSGQGDVLELRTGVCTTGEHSTLIEDSSTIVSVSREFDLIRSETLSDRENCAYVAWLTNEEGTDYRGFTCQYSWSYVDTSPHTNTYGAASGVFSNHGYYINQCVSD
ncbi:LOW QUALITY PROTEIN: hypothetical protein KIPB_007270 [Kipferlia bialata]|uniref:Uncharacterized protein n=1 Tax=Kipferlia bialata TaxID=797122 RepID=A0A9K3D027_9EUKA|nr:LOW QUALITY PROTEIN: hypothetical protein KIPB_007270 [Kipferlia bialata]